jgi:hypothetical protein
LKLPVHLWNDQPGFGNFLAGGALRLQFGAITFWILHNNVLQKRQTRLLPASKIHRGLVVLLSRGPVIMS